jgi:hypothetical protein
MTIALRLGHYSNSVVDRGLGRTTAAARERSGDRLRQVDRHYFGGAPWDGGFDLAVLAPLGKVKPPSTIMSKF